MSTKPFNILYIQGVTRMGGSIQSLLGLLKRLDKEKFSPIVLTSKTGKFTEELRELGIEAKVIKMEMWRKGKNLLRAPISIFLIQKLLHDKRIDLIHSNTLWDNPYGVIPAKFRKVPSVCHLRNTFSPDKIKKYFLLWADRIICISDEIKKRFNSLEKKEEKILTIYNGVDLEKFNNNIKGDRIRKEFNIGEKDFLVGMVGRVDRTKGQDMLLKAFSTLNERYENLKLMIVGESSHRDRGYFFELKKLAGSLNLHQKVIFTGYRKDIPEITAALDLAVFPSLPSSNEGFGRSIIEAMAMKKAVVASDTGGIPEVVIDGVTGELVPPNDPQRLAESIEKLIADEEMRFAMGEKGYMAVVEKFTLERNVRETEKVYLSLLESRKK